MASTTANLGSNKAAALAQVQALVAGTLKHFPNGTFTLGNTTYTTATLVEALKNLEQVLVALNAAQANAKDAVTALRNNETTSAPLVRAYKRFVYAAFSTATQQLADFGLQAPKARQPLTSDQRAAATAKLRATRKARGTTSKKQKLAIKGDVTGVIVTPVTAPKAPTPVSPQPAPTPTPAPAPAPAHAVSSQ